MNEHIFSVNVMTNGRIFSSCLGPEKVIFVTFKVQKYFFVTFKTQIFFCVGMNVEVNGHTSVMNDELNAVQIFNRRT